MKERITKKQIIALPNFNKLFQVKCDASGMDIGVVLSQDERPIAYFSENLNDTKKSIILMIKSFMK